MKILMYGWEFPPRISGGLGVACYAIVKSLAQLGHKVSFVLPYELEAPNMGPNVKILGCDFVADMLKDGYLKGSGDIDWDRISQMLLTPYGQMEDFNEVCRDLCGGDETLMARIALKISQLANKRKVFSGKYGGDLYAEVYRFAELAGRMALTVDCDVIHAHDWLTIMAGIKARQLTGKPLVFHVHALEYDRSGMDNVNQKIYTIEKLGLREADKIVTVSEYTKNVLATCYGVPCSKIAVAYNGIELPDWQGANDQSNPPYKTVLFLGRITHQKGPYYFVEVAKKILQKRPEVHFVVAGNGDMFKDMINKVAELRIGQNVHFTGFLNRQMVEKVLSKSDVYVMPSVSEPFGISCLEALAANVPVVISKQSGVAETLNGVLTADFWDVNKMAEQILALLDHPELAQEMLANMRPDVEKLTWERNARRLVGVYLGCKDVGM